MTLSAAFLLIVWFVAALSVEIPKGPLFEETTSHDVERPNSIEIVDKEKEETESRKELQPLSFSDEYPVEESRLEDKNELPSVREKHREKRNRRFHQGYPDYHYEDPIVEESPAFEREWNYGVALQISHIGKYEPSQWGEKDQRRRRDTGRKANTLYKRDGQRAFARITGCNRLPLAPANSFGICYHNDDIGKCWVRCHRFSRYPNDMGQRNLICLDGLWRPTKLPDCFPQTPCDETQLSGSNMNVSCISAQNKTKCTGTCEDGFTFPDNEILKEVECEEMDGGFVTRTKFPDCSFGGNTTYESINTTGEPKNDTWIYF